MCVYIYIQICTHVCVCLFVFVCLHIVLCVCTHMCANTHTHTLLLFELGSENNNKTHRRRDIDWEAHARTKYLHTGIASCTLQKSCCLLGLAASMFFLGRSFSSLASFWHTPRNTQLKVMALPREHPKRLQRLESDPSAGLGENLVEGTLHFS